MATGRERIIPVYVEDEMKSSYIDYSMSVIVQRALPDVRDGLKPVHRRIGRADDTRTEEQAEDFPLLEIVKKDAGRLLGIEAAPAYVLLLSQRAVFAVIGADIGKQNLKNACLAAIG